MNDLWRLPATELAQLIRDRQVSAKEAAVAGLARLDAVNPAINAVVEHRPDDVLAQAAAIGGFCYCRQWLGAPVHWFPGDFRKLQIISPLAKLHPVHI